MDCLLGLSGDLRGFFADYVEVLDGGEGGDGNPCRCFSMADVVALECSLTLSPRALDVSPNI